MGIALGFCTLASEWWTNGGSLMVNKGKVRTGIGEITVDKCWTNGGSTVRKKER